MALLKAVIPWASNSNDAVDTIWDLLWHFYTGGVDTTYPACIGIGIDGYGCYVDVTQGKFCFAGFPFLIQK